MGLLVPVQTLQVKSDVLGPLKIFVDYSLPDEKTNGTIICPYDKLSLISKVTFQFNGSKWRTILWCIYSVSLQKRQPLSLAILRPFLVIFLPTAFISFTKLMCWGSFWGAKCVKSYKTKHKFSCFQFFSILDEKLLKIYDS